MAKTTTITHLGCSGHLIVARNCNWRRHTQIVGEHGAFRVSTIGDYYPDNPRGQRATIGAGADSFFETMVFAVSSTPEDGSEGCGCFMVKSWSELDGERYATAGAAQAGHERFVKLYTGRARHGR